MDGRMYPDSDRIKHFRNPRQHAHAHGKHAEVEVRYDDASCDTVDEIVTTQIHLEKMDDGRCWMSVNGLHVWFVADKDGNLRVTCIPSEAKPFTVAPGASSRGQ